MANIQAALVSAQQEVKFALVHLNFDFALSRRDAPPAYREVGDHISTKRRNDAEQGTIHRTAQRLSSLFQSSLPQTPALVETYGLRAGDIARDLGRDSNGLHKGAFSEYAGLDATSLYAAAVSNDVAIALHLLACMIARMFGAREAIAVWQELVTERRQRLQDNSVNEFEKATAISADIQQSHLEEWDNSARAWLEAADKLPFLVKKQTQLRLIFTNLGSVGVGSRNVVYDSVLDAWTRSLTAMENIIKGGSFTISDGAVLMAISAWHLYPDMIVLGAQTKLIEQRDLLLSQAGRVTVGIQRATTTTDPGVYWSLDLKYLRYYGSSTLTSGVLKLEPNRLSLDQFLFGILGAMYRLWNVGPKEFEHSSRLLTLVAECCLNVPLSDLSNLMDGQNSNLRWLAPLAYSANIHYRSSGEERAQIEGLIRMGYKRPHIIGFAAAPSPWILFMRSFDFLYWAANYDIWLKLLRNALATVPSHEKSGLLVRRVREKDSDPAEQIETLFPIKIAKESEHVNLKWIVAKNISTDSEIQQSSHNNTDRIKTIVQQIHPEDIRLYSFNDRMIWSNYPNELIESARRNVNPSPKSASKGRGRPQSQRSLDASASSIKETSHDLLVGSSNSISLLAPTYLKLGNREPLSKYRPTIKDLASLMQSGEIDPGKVKKYFLQVGKNTFADSLVALEFIVRIYLTLPGATISTSVFDKGSSNLGRTCGQQETYGPSHQNLRKLAIKTVALLELGTLMELDSGQAFAISINDSIYLVDELLADPFPLEESECHVKPARPYLHRIHGNIGQAGLTLLIPPTHPRVRSPKAEEWEMVSHSPFDGKLEDNFTSTALQLRFTGYEIPVDHAMHGVRFNGVQLKETVVSVYDAGRWSADLDLNNYLKKDKTGYIDVVTCRCRARGDQTQTLTNADLTAIDSWSELLDPPFEAGVVRTYKNIPARIATSIVSRMRGHPTFMFRGDPCWPCAFSKAKETLGTLKVPSNAPVIPGRNQRRRPSRELSSDEDEVDDDNNQDECNDTKHPMFIL